MPFPEGVYGLLAEFDSVTSLTAAAAAAYKDGWRRLDCYTPYPCEEAAEAIGFHRNYVPLITLVGGLMGCVAMFLMETWINVWAYPLNIAGRPYYSWPAFVVPAYEWTILWAGLTAAFGMLAHVRSARAISPALQRAELPYRRNVGQAFPVPRGAGSQVFARRVAGLSRSHASGLDRGGGVLSRGAQLDQIASGMRACACGRALACVRWRPRLMLLAGCRQDMQDQPKFVPQRGTVLFP